ARTSIAPAARSDWPTTDANLWNGGGNMSPNPNTSFLLPATLRRSPLTLSVRLRRLGPNSAAALSLRIGGVGFILLRSRMKERDGTFIFTLSLTPTGLTAAALLVSGPTVLDKILPLLR